MEDCNGWSNYATWRVNLEIIDKIDFDELTDAGALKEIVECVVFNEDSKNEQSFIQDYAEAFLANVNYYEIANAINAELALQN